MAEYHFPPIDLLEESKEYSSFTDLRYEGEMKEKIAGMFAAFKMDVKVVDSGNNAYSVLLKLQLGKNVTPKMIRNLRNDIEVALDGNPVDFMDDADGKGITVAVKNTKRPKIMIKDVIRSSAFREAQSCLTIAAGVNLFAGYMTIDLASLPNLIVLGVTGAGKTTFLNDILLSILYKARPDEVKLAMIDTKGVDLPLLNGIPHTEGFRVANTAPSGVRILQWLMNESMERISLMRPKRVESLEEYNKYSTEKKPRIVLVIDEYSDFKEKSSQDVDGMVELIARNSVLTGIHIVLATQSARKEHLSARIKDAIPARACLVVADERESRIALDRIGAGRLAGDGDMIFTRDENDPGIRIQAAYASDEEIDSVVYFLRNEVEVK
ncbi:MAG: DNA translocase FtsK [Firmicutes bacterium]|nr:DNA translocase FtsK [Bacillota bacterium]